MFVPSKTHVGVVPSLFSIHGSLLCESVVEHWKFQ